MASKSLWRSLHYSAKRRNVLSTAPYRCFSCSLRAAQSPSNKAEENARMTHFGFESIPEGEKESTGLCVFIVKTIKQLEMLTVQ
jgi:2-methoxy-6-polyprenyl-1,4-benzoquinol methylase